MVFSTLVFCSIDICEYVEELSLPQDGLPIYLRNVQVEFWCTFSSYSSGDVDLRDCVLLDRFSGSGQKWNSPLYVCGGILLVCECGVNRYAILLGLQNYISNE